MSTDIWNLEEIGPRDIQNCREMNEQVIGDILDDDLGEEGELSGQFRVLQTKKCTQ